MDFVNTELHGPQAGNCAEQFLVVGGDIWPTGFDKICGVNPDQHFYVHIDREKQAEAEQGGERGDSITCSRLFAFRWPILPLGGESAGEVK